MSSLGSTSVLQFVQQIEADYSDAALRVARLATMPKLRYLALYGSKLTANTIESLKQSPSIQSIGLSVSRLESGILSELTKLPHLKWLGINSSNISRDDIERCREIGPQFELLLSLEMQVRLGFV